MKNLQKRSKGVETKIVKLSEIKPAPYNPRVELTAKDQEYKALDASIEEHGLVLPLIVNLRDNCLIGGHQRLSVLLAEGEIETNAVVVDMDEAQAKALCIALNKLDGDWDYGKLAELLQDLIEEQENLASTGFTQKDIDELLGELYYDMKRRNGYSEEQIMDKRRSLENVLSPLKPEWNVDMLRTAGFDKVDMFWRCLNFCGWIAVK
jgi:ParB-like chromosome segregation protein Spo0J